MRAAKKSFEVREMVVLQWLCARIAENITTTESWIWTSPASAGLAYPSRYFARYLSIRLAVKNLDSVSDILQTLNKRKLFVSWKIMSRILVLVSQFTPFEVACRVILRLR